MAAIESNSPTLPATVSGSADSWSFESNSIGADTSEVLAQATDPGDEPAPDENEPPPPPEPEPAKEPVAAKPAEAKPGKTKQTISQRTAVLKAELQEALQARGSTRAEVEDLRRQRDAIRAEIEGLQRGRQPAPIRQPDRPPAVSPLGPAPDWDTYEREGKTWKEYEAASRAHVVAEAEARAEAKIRAEIAAIEDRSRTDQQRARETQIAHAYAQKMEATEAKYPDFAALVDANLAGVKTTGFMSAILKLHPQGGEVLYHWARNPHEAEILATISQPTRPVMDAIAKAENPIPLLSHFAAHRAEFESLTQMPPAEQLYELGRLAERLSGARASSDPPRRSSVHSPAPPFRAMGGTAAAGGAEADSSGDDFADYVRAENRRQELRAGRRR